MPWTASVGSTEESAAAESPTNDRPSRYLVPTWVRVRREDFGLLFYDTRSTRLTYVRSGDSLVPPPFTGTPRVLECASTEAAQRPAVARLLQNLVAKGLIVAVEAD